MQTLTRLSSWREKISQKISFLDTANDCMIALAFDGTIQSWNEGAQKLYGYSETEALGKNIRSFIPGPDLKKFSDRLQKIREGRVVRSYVAERFTRGGQRYPTWYYVNPLKDQAGNSNAVFFAARDFSNRETEHKRLRKTRHEIKGSESRQDNHFRTLMENTVEIAAILNGNSYITFISSSVKRFLNYEPAELTGLSIFDFIHPGDLFTALEGYAQILDGRKNSEVMDLRIRHKNGQWCPMEIKASNFLNDPGIRGLLVYARDLTEQKRLEDDILKIGEEEHLKIAEELHDGLTQELAGIEFIAKSLEQKIRQQFPQLLTDASRVASLIGQTVKSTRDLARGLYPMEMKASGFFNALERLTDEMTRQCEVVCDLFYDKSIQIREERIATQSYYIIREAVLNAIRHGQAPRISISIQQSNEKLVLTVRDNGNGFLKPQGKGQGIGMKIMNHRVRMLNGALDILRNASGGTTLICSFPHKVTKGENHD